MDNDNSRGLSLPTVSTETITVLESETVYDGPVTGIPDCLVSYLRPIELKVYALIIRETRKSGGCLISKSRMARELGLSFPTVTTALLALSRMRLVRLGARNRVEGLNFHAVKNIDTLLNDTRMETTPRLRRILRDKTAGDVTPLQAERIAICCTDNSDEDEEYC